jgi:hypothetical protein
VYFVEASNKRLGSPGFTGFSEPVPGMADARKALLAVAEIRHQLGRNFRADDEAGVLDRRQRLREAFNSVPKAFALSLWSRLTDKNDELGKFFRYRLATPTRNEMLAILLRNSSESL